MISTLFTGWQIATVVDIEVKALH